MELVGEEHRESFHKAMQMRGHPICRGRYPCEETHGDVWFPFDVFQFVERLELTPPYIGRRRL